MIRRTYEYLQQESVDIVLFGMSRVNGEGKLLSTTLPTPSQRVFRGKSVQEILLPGVLDKDPQTGMRMGIPCSACSIMFSADLVCKANWRFVSEREYISEDIYSLLMLFKYINSAAVLCDALYFYRINFSSLTRINRDDRYEKAKQCYYQCSALCKELEYPQVVQNACIGPYFGSTIEAIKQIANNKKSVFEARKRIKNILDDDLLQSVLNTRVKTPQRWAIKWLIWTMKNKKYTMCYALAKLHCIREKKCIKE